MKTHYRLLALTLLSTALFLEGCNMDEGSTTGSTALPASADKTIYTNQSEAGSDDEVVDNQLSALKDASAPGETSGLQPTTFAGHSRQELMACLGAPARAMTISGVDYLSYVESTCQATYTIENDQVKEVIYTSNEGQPITDACVIAHGKCNG